MFEQDVRPVKRKSFNPAWLLAILVPIIYLYAINRFLNTTDGYQQYRISGWEVVNQLPGFWTWLVVGIIGSLLCLAIVVLNETGAWIGRYLRGAPIVNWIFSALAILCLILPWTKAFSIKANGGVDLPKTKIQSYETRTTYCSTAGNTCSFSTYGILTEG